MVKKSIVINNLAEYTFRLNVDDVNGIIRLTKNTSKGKTTRITERNITVNTDTKWRFHNIRSGYSAVPTDKYKFVGSYIDREKDPILYNNWEKFVYDRYTQLKKNQEVSNESR